MTKHAKLRLFLLLITVVALAAAYQQMATESVMVKTANNFLASLSDTQRAKATMKFEGDVRTHWHFVPDNSYEQTYKHPRRGITYKELQPFQRRMADALLSAGLSSAGYVKANSIISLEEVLRVAENAPAGRRDSEMYYFGIFGAPSETGTWGWSMEGHHLSFNFTIKDGKLVSSSPTFYGANPHAMKEGPRKGLRPLGAEEDRARNLMRALSADQQKQAMIQDEAFRDILTSADIRAELDGDPQGLPAAKMNDKQFAALSDLVAEYAHNMPPDVAERRMKTVTGTPRDQIFFAWAGGVKPGEGHYYRVQGPSFLVEYTNTQNNANHSHTVWRDFAGDFGFDVLAVHHKLYDHGIGIAAD